MSAIRQPVLGLVCAMCIAGAAALRAEDGGVMPRQLLDPAGAGAQAQIAIAVPDQVTATVAAAGIDLAIAPGEAPYPGIAITPADGKPWPLTAYGHVEAAITNTGAAQASINLRVDDAGPGDQPWNAEAISLRAGETRTIRVYFGYSYGFRKGHALRSEAVTRVLFFTGKAAAPQSFRIARISAAGTPGEAPGRNVEQQRVKPVAGDLLAAANPVAASVRGAAVAGEGLRATVAAGSGILSVHPAQGLWDLGDAMQVTVRLRNDGAAPAKPRLQLVSDDGGTTAWSGPAEAIAPGAEAAVVIPFAPATPWQAVVDPAQVDHAAKGRWSNQPGTGTGFRSHRTAALDVALDQPGGVTVLAATASAPPAELPAWLGTRPPVAGAWKQTLDEDFTGDRIDPHRWNVHAFNWWDKRQHFSADEVIVGDGVLRLRVEKRRGHHNDDPAQPESDYAVGWADTYGKWTQRYGYVEIRARLPTAPCLWPGVWMMPDRGLRAFPASDPKGHWEGFKARGTQDGSGMEFDIIEAQSIWGPHRFNIAMHWDGYAEHHKVVGTSANYVATDADGFIVVGMLWLPGSLTMYGNGQPILSWQSPRIPDTQQTLILQNLIGGWEVEALDDSRLPADLVIDWIRVWQRDDLASPEDGAKPNAGGPDAYGETLPAK